MLPSVISSRTQDGQESSMLAVVRIGRICPIIFSRHFHTDIKIHLRTDVAMSRGKFIPIEDTGFQLTLDLRKLWFSGFQHIVSSEPSSTLVSLLQSFNPDFLFHFPFVKTRVAAADMVLEWLKVRPTAQFIKIDNVEFLL
jgi:hypothetical protein